MRKQSYDNNCLLLPVMQEGRTLKTNNLEFVGGDVADPAGNLLCALWSKARLQIDR